MIIKKKITGGSECNCSSDNLGNSNYDKALSAIKCAIDELCAVAEGDNHAQQAIADLSIILFDLQN